MASYLETNYFKEEYAETDYPQILCNHLIDEYLMKHSDVEGKSILDIGSGKGNHLVGFSRRGMKAFGIDKRDECVSILENFDIRECNIEKDAFPFEDNTFDFVFSKSVMEHIDNVENFFQQSARVLKPEGYALFLTPDWRSQASHFWDDWTHVRPYTRKALQNAMRMNGFDCVECDYFVQLPLLWKNPWLKPIVKIMSLLPESLKWKDKEESIHRPWIRFSKELMLVAYGIKKKG